MAKTVTPLTVTKINNAKPKDKLYRLFDGNGLCLKILTSGSKIWEYRFKNPSTAKEDTLIIGEYPLISLSEARAIQIEKRSMVLKGIDPKIKIKSLLFEDLFLEWFNVWNKGTKHNEAIGSAIQRYVTPTLKNFEVGKIEPSHIVKALRELEKEGVLDTLKKTKSGLKQMFDYLVAEGHIKYNPVIQVATSIFKKPKKSHHRRLGNSQVYMIHEFLNYDGISPMIRLCTEFIMRTVLRAKEACTLKWDYYDEKNQLIIIPSQNMKVKDGNDHIVSLSSQAIEILIKLKEITGDYEYIFMNPEFTDHINTEATTNAMKQQSIPTTTHGFRSLASTIINEGSLFRSGAIEACLAHRDKDTIRATYNKAKYLQERREILQWWSDFIDQCDTEENNLLTLQKYDILNILGAMS